MRKVLIFCVVIVAVSFQISAQNKPQISEIDRLRIAEAFRIGEKLQNKLWKNWDKSPFALLLIDDETEFLIRHPKPSDEFQSIGYDGLLKSEIFVRPRKFQKGFLATFPAFNITPVIVVGKAENTYLKTSTPWVFTVLHEHFHQMQMSDSTYFSDVESLNLSRGDTSGMWQINFPFPYSKKEIGDQFKILSNLLRETYNTPTESERRQKLEQYLVKRKQFAESLNADDYKYFSFQLWQEGIARYTEYKLMELAAKKMKPSKAFKSLKDFTTFADEADKLFAATDKELKNINLSESERIVFYPFGAFEGFLLDKINPKWRDRYLTEKFAIETFYVKK